MHDKTKTEKIDDFEGIYLMKNPSFIAERQRLEGFKLALN